MTRSRIIHGLYFPAGPLVRGTAFGPAGQRDGLLLIDTGATLSAIDLEIARQLRMPTSAAVQWRAVNQAVGEISALRTGSLQIADDPRRWEMHLIEVPLLDRIAGYRLIGLLGLDFLERCKLTFDGPARSFLLELPR